MFHDNDIVATYKTCCFRSNCGYHSVADYGGLAPHPYDYIACEPLILELSTTAGCFCGQAIKFYNAEGDAHGVIGSLSIIDCIV